MQTYHANRFLQQIKILKNTAHIALKPPVDILRDHEFTRKHGIS